MHDDPARRWRVGELAAEAGLSRTAFAVRFRRVGGETPMGYLTTLRMLRAAEALRRGDAPLARVAAEAGYASESAFGTAFRRTMGDAPRRHAARAEGPRLGRAVRSLIFRIVPPWTPHPANVEAPAHEADAMASCAPVRACTLRRPGSPRR